MAVSNWRKLSISAVYDFSFHILVRCFVVIMYIYTEFNRMFNGIGWENMVVLIMAVSLS
jgi:hypothetical protein